MLHLLMDNKCLEVNGWINNSRKHSASHSSSFHNDARVGRWISSLCRLNSSAAAAVGTSPPGFRGNKVWGQRGEINAGDAVSNESQIPAAQLGQQLLRSSAASHFISTGPQNAVYLDLLQPETPGRHSRRPPGSSRQPTPKINKQIDE